MAIAMADSQDAPILPATFPAQWPGHSGGPAPRFHGPLVPISSPSFGRHKAARPNRGLWTGSEDSLRGAVPGPAGMRMIGWIGSRLKAATGFVGLGLAGKGHSSCDPCLQAPSPAQKQTLHLERGGPAGPRLQVSRWSGADRDRESGRPAHGRRHGEAGLRSVSPSSATGHTGRAEGQKGQGARLRGPGGDGNAGLGFVAPGEGFELLGRSHNANPAVLIVGAVEAQAEIGGRTFRQQCFRAIARILGISLVVPSETTWNHRFGRHTLKEIASTLKGDRVQRRVRDDTPYTPCIANMSQLRRTAACTIPNSRRLTCSILREIQPTERIALNCLPMKVTRFAMGRVVEANRYCVNRSSSTNCGSSSQRCCSGTDSGLSISRSLTSGVLDFSPLVTLLLTHDSPPRNDRPFLGILGTINPC